MGIPMADAVIKKIQIGQNSHFLPTEGGTLFFWLGDTAFGLIHQTTREEADLNFENSRKRGPYLNYSVVLAEMDGINIANSFSYISLYELNPEKPKYVYKESS
jgi:hypothetical protein